MCFKGCAWVNLVRLLSYGYCLVHLLLLPLETFNKEINIDEVHTMHQDQMVPGTCMLTMFPSKKT